MILMDFYTMVSTCFGVIQSLHISFYYDFVWSRTANESSRHELCIWSIVFMQSDFKMVYVSNKKSFVFISTTR